MPRVYLPPVEEKADEEDGDLESVPSTRSTNTAISASSRLRARARVEEPERDSDEEKKDEPDVVDIRGFPVSWQWLGGFVSGDGSVGLNRDFRSKIGFGRFRLVLTQKKRGVLDFVKRILRGKGSIAPHYVKGQPRTLDNVLHWEWRLTNRADVEWVLFHIIPYLDAKREEAVLLLEYFELVDEFNTQVRGMKKGGPQWLRIGRQFKPQFLDKIDKVVALKADVVHEDLPASDNDEEPEEEKEEKKAASHRRFGRHGHASNRIADRPMVARVKRDRAARAAARI